MQNNSAKTRAPIVKNAVQCSVCGAAADRYESFYLCQVNPNHFGDLNVGIFNDLTPPRASGSKLISTD